MPIATVIEKVRFLSCWRQQSAGVYWFDSNLFCIFRYVKGRPFSYSYSLQTPAIKLYAISIFQCNTQLYRLLRYRNSRSKLNDIPYLRGLDTSACSNFNIGVESRHAGKCGWYESALGDTPR